MTQLCFWICWGFAAIVAAVILYFFCWGLADGSVSSFNMTLWIGLLVAVAIVIGGSFCLRMIGRPVLGLLLSLVLVLPGLVYGLFLLLVIIFRPRWN